MSNHVAINQIPISSVHDPL